MELGRVGVEAAAGCAATGATLDDGARGDESDLGQLRGAVASFAHGT